MGTAFSNFKICKCLAGKTKTRHTLTPELLGHALPRIYTFEKRSSIGITFRIATGYNDFLDRSLTFKLKRSANLTLRFVSR